jgi:hypothetical protein
MWMTSYIAEIQRQLIDQYGFPENHDHAGTVLGDVPDGEYPMTIEGRLDHVRIKDGKISCCNFDEASASSKPSSTLRSG